VIRANVMKRAAWLKGFTPDMLPGVMINTSATDFAPLSQHAVQGREVGVVR